MLNDSDIHSRIPRFDKLSDHTIKLGEDLQNSKKKWIHKTNKKRSRLTRITWDWTDDYYNFSDFLFKILLFLIFVFQI